MSAESGNDLVQFTGEAYKGSFKADLLAELVSG